jgi:catalase
VKELDPLPGQVLTNDDTARLQRLGDNGDRIDAAAWGTWTASVPNDRATAEEVLSGMRDVKIAKRELAMK